MLHLEEVQAVRKRGAQLLERAKHAVGASNMLHLLVARALEERERLLEFNAAGGVLPERGFDPPGGKLTLVHECGAFNPHHSHSATTTDARVC